MNESLALVACAILACLTIFQLLLIAGVPIGEYAWGGAHKVIPAKFRIGSAISITLYGIFAAVILDKSGSFELIGSKGFVNIGIWIFVIYFFIGVVMNGISRSKHERNVMTPVALILALLFLSIANS